MLHNDLAVTVTFIQNTTVTKNYPKSLLILQIMNWRHRPTYNLDNLENKLKLPESLNYGYYHKSNGKNVSVVIHTSITEVSGNGHITLE